MRTEGEPKLSPRMQRAVEELKGLVRQRFPGATFQVARDPEEPRSIDLLTTTDVEDRQDVVNVVRDRLLQFQIQEKLPIHVIPLHTVERAGAILQRQMDVADLDIHVGGDAGA